MTDISQFGGLPLLGRRERFLPDFRSPSCTFILLLLGELLAFALALVKVSSLDAFWFELGIDSLFILCIVVVCQLILAVFAKHLDQMAGVTAGFVVFLAVTLTSFLMTLAFYRLSPEAAESLASAGGNLSFQSLSNAALAGMTAAVGLRYHYVHHLLRMQVKAETSARLDALQSRMKPHFLFNGLNSIASLIRRDPALAEELTLDLSELFRAILRRDIRLASLKEEIALSQRYLKIEQLRLGERLRVVWNLDDDTLGALIPPLSLQPLIENAIYHGVEPSPAGGDLEISCQPHKNSTIILTVRNSLSESNVAAERLGNRVALNNLRLRLQSVFREEGKLTSSMTDGVYLTRIIIPYTTWRDHENTSGR